MARDKSKNTPLHDAAEFTEDLAVIEALLKAAAAPTARDDDKDTPLHFAAFNNQDLAVIEALLKAGADQSLPGKAQGFRRSHDD